MAADEGIIGYCIQLEESIMIHENLLNAQPSDLDQVTAEKG